MIRGGAGIQTGLRALVACLSVLLVLASAGLAQNSLTDEERAYLEQWDRTAQRAEEAVEANRASTAALEALREEVVGYRRTFANARDDSSARLTTLQAQMDALGPAPEEGLTEPADIAALRTQLSARIEALRVPVVVTHENFNRSDGLIREIDRLIRDRRTEQLLTRTVSPLNPELVWTAWDDNIEGIKALYNETRLNIKSKMEQKLLRKTAPAVLVLTGLGLLLLLRGRTWSERIGNYLRGFGGRGTGVWRFLVSLGRILFPLIGVYLLSRAIVVSQILGLRGQLILDHVPYWAAVLLGYRWLAERLYPKRSEDSIFGMSDPNRGPARRTLFAMGAMLVLFDALHLFEEIENVSDGSRAVMGLPAVLLASLVLLRLRRIVTRESELILQESGDAPARTGLMRLGPVLRVLSLIIAVAAPVLSVVGLGELAELILYAFFQTLALYGGVLVFQRFFVDVYAWMSGKGLAAVEETIVPFVIGFVMVITALPTLALIWGARVVELTELWERFLAGITVGGSTIRPQDFLTFIVVFVIGYMLTRLFQNALSKNLLPKTRIDPGGQTAIVSGTGYVGIFLAAIIAFSTAGINLSSLAIVAGALSVGIGFGLQNIVSNFVSGIILLIERPVSEGDWIEVGGQMGYVRDISVRSTRIETFDRTDVIVPNSDLVSGTVTNYTRGNTVGRVIVPVGVAYGTDTKMVEKILHEIANAHPMVLASPPPSVVFQGFGADSLDFEIRAILRDVNWVLAVKSDLNHEIARRFTEADIEIPFAQRDIWLRNPETLTGGRPGGAPDDTANAEDATPTDPPEKAPSKPTG